MISKHLDGHVVCLECAGVTTLESYARCTFEQRWLLHKQSTRFPETDCEHVREVRRAEWEAKMRAIQEAGEDLKMKLLLQSTLGGIPDLELVPGPAPEWMVS